MTPALVDSGGRPLRAQAATGQTAWTARPAYVAGGYDSADLACWTASLRPADREVLESRREIVARARDLVRNDGIISGAVTTDLESVIGTGIRFRPRPDWRALGLDEDWARDFGARLQALVDAWGNDPDRRCDLRQQLTLSDMQRLVRRHMLVDGEALVVARWRPAARAVLATRLQMIDPDRLDDPRHAVLDEETMAGGVEKDADGRPVAYHIRNRHPGSTAWRGADDFVRVPAWSLPGRRQVLHVYHSERAEQSRGISRMATILSRAKALHNYTTAELQTAQVNAMFAAYLESDFAQQAVAAMGDPEESGGIADYTDARANYLKSQDIRLNGSRVQPLFPGDKLHLFTGARESESFERFTSTTIRHMAAGLGLSYEEMARNYSETNYSSARASLLQAWRTFRYETHFIGAGFVLPVIDLIAQEGIDRGMLPMPEAAPPYDLFKSAYLAGRMLGPARGWVDPVKEAEGAHRRIDGMFSTYEREAAEQGLAFEEVLEDRRREAELMADYGLSPAPRAGSPSPAEAPERREEEPA